MRLARYELIHIWTTPLKPYKIFSRRSKIGWSTVSNAADKSSSVSIDRSPRSAAVNITFTILTIAIVIIAIPSF